MNDDGSKLVPPETRVTLLAFTTGEALLTSGARLGSWSACASAFVSETLLAVLAPGEAPQTAAALHEQHVRAEALDARLHGLGGAVADGDQDDHRGDADRHAEDRQARSAACWR